MKSLIQLEKVIEMARDLVSAVEPSSMKIEFWEGDTDDVPSDFVVARISGSLGARKVVFELRVEHIL